MTTVLIAPADPEAGSRPDELTVLLTGYRAAIQVAEELPPMLTVKAGDGRYLCRVRVPRMRLFLRFYLAQHVRRRLGLLQRAFHAEAALGADHAAALAALSHFEQSLRPVPVRRLVIWFVVSVLLAAVALANLARALAEVPLKRAGDALQGSFSSVISVDTEGLIDAAGMFDLESGAAAVIVTTLSLYVISALPITSFRLKRMLLNLTPTDAMRLRRTAALDHVARADGLYEQERRVFAGCGLPYPREFPFDLIAQSTLMFFPLVLGVWLAIANLETLVTAARADVLAAVVALTAAAWLFLVLPLGRLAHLWSIWCRRQADAAGAVPRQPFVREELAHPLRRLAAFMVDLPLTVLAAVLASALIQLLPLSIGVMVTLWWFIGVPVALAVATIPFMLREGEHEGQSLGKQALGIRVVCDSHGRLSRRRVVIRELLCKSPFWTGPSVAMLGVPALVNGLCSILDPENRALQDRVAGTRVVRAAKRA